MSNLRDIGLNKRKRLELLHAVQYPVQQNWPTVCPPSLTALTGIVVFMFTEKRTKKNHVHLEDIVADHLLKRSYLFHIYVYEKIISFSHIYIYIYI